MHHSSHLHFRQMGLSWLLVLTSLLLLRQGTHIRASSHGVPCPKSPSHLRSILCNLNCWEHGCWDFPLYTWSQILSVKSLEVIPVQSQLLRAWMLGLTTSHGVLSPKSQVWHGCLHDDTYWRWGLGFVLRVGLSKKLDPTLNTSLSHFLHYNIQL